MTSSRLPGKVLAEVAGKPMLALQLDRIRNMSTIDDVVVATTNLTSDDPVVALAARQEVRWFRGDENDVLGRYLGAAREVKADVVVRITADCPLIDAVEADRVVAALCEYQVDYAANVLQRTYPQGLDTEAFFVDALERSHRLATSSPSREHVTWFMSRERTDLFLLHSVTDRQDNSDLRWTVDTVDDLAVVRRIYEEMGVLATTSYRDILAWVRKNPELAHANQHVIQKDL